MSTGNLMPLINGEIPVVQENISMFPAELCRSVSLMLRCTVLDVDEVVFLRGFNTAQDI